MVQSMDDNGIKITACDCSGHTHSRINWRLYLTVLSGVLILCGFFSPYFFLGSIVASVFFVLPKAWESVKKFSPDMNLLLVVAAGGAIALGDFFEAAMLCFLFAVSLLLEQWSLGRAKHAIEALMDLTPPVANVVGKGAVGVGDVEVGARILVKPGERVPLDGVVTKGASEVNQAPITGESLPVDKGEGAEVFAGSVNGQGALEIEVTKKSSDTTLARMIQMVQSAGAARAKSEQWVEKFAKVYTPIMILLALGFALIPPLFFGHPFATWIYRGLVILVIACPCALVISTPVTIVAGLTSAARNGVLIKGGRFLDMAAHLKALAFDKTGTLTTGQLKVVQVLPQGDHSREEVVEIAASLEKYSEHPIARAIAKLGGSMEVVNFQSIPGNGAEGTIAGKRFWIGSARDDAREEMRPFIALQCEGEVWGYIEVQDTLREEAKHTLEHLRDSGVEHCLMLTGDHQVTAEKISGQIGLDGFFAELLPEDKVAQVEELVQTYGQVAMVGDGVNDAPAMARSSMGIAMGALGTDAAIETSDVALMTDDLHLIPLLIDHAKKTMRVVKQNITFALLIKALFITLAFFGEATLWMAIAADTGASLCVVFNGLRMLSSNHATCDYSAPASS